MYSLKALEYAGTDAMLNNSIWLDSILTLLNLRCVEIEWCVRPKKLFVSCNGT